MWFWEQFLGSLIGCFVGIIFSFLIFHLYTKQKYSGWKVIIKNGDSKIVERNVGPKKAENVLEDQSDLAVFIKGVVSPYCQLNEDIISKKAQELGLFKESKKERIWLIDISKNPSK